MHLRHVFYAVAAILGVLVLGYVYLFHLIPDTGDAELSGHGILAMVLGIVFSLALGIGLMALVFFSSRRGYDEGQRPRDDGER